MKPLGLLEAKAAAAIADSAAFIFIDAIDPPRHGRPKTPSSHGEVFERLMPFYSHLGGERIADVFGYYSFESKIDFRDNGKHVKEVSHRDSHTTSTMNAAAHLLSRHVPYGVLTKESLHRLAEAKVLMLCNVNMMDEEECDVIRRWVADGGRLYGVRWKLGGR